MVVFEATAKRYSGKPNPFQVDDWVYRLLPVAVTNVSRKMQVNWVGPFQVTRIVHQCQVELRVEGKLVVAHVGHLVKATGDRPKIVPLRDVAHYLTQNGFPNQQSQEFLEWQWPPKTVEIRQRRRGVPPLNESNNNETSSNSSISTGQPSDHPWGGGEPDESMQPSESQRPATAHSMDPSSGNTVEPPQIRCANLSGAGTSIVTPVDNQ